MLRLASILFAATLLASTAAAADPTSRDPLKVPAGSATRVAQSNCRAS